MERSEELFQIGVKALIKNGGGDILVVHQGDRKYLDLPGGRMEPGESIRETLIRELREELGVRFDGPMSLLDTVLSNVRMTVDDHSVPLVMVIYEVTLDAETIFAPEETDMIVEWLPASEVAKAIEFKFPRSFTSTLG